tara:strand:- start:480 stop:617 length:138 start_codon:yes stop_codon:yes gene_type:complete
MAKQVFKLPGTNRIQKKTSIGRNPGTSTMNKSKKRTFKKYRGQGR